MGQILRMRWIWFYIVCRHLVQISGDRIGQYFVGNHDLLSLSSNSFIIARSIPEELDMLKPEKSLLFDSDMGKFFIATNGKMSEIAHF